MELDAPKPQDLSKIMADIRAQYDELAQKNREELDKYWSQQVRERMGWMPSEAQRQEGAGGRRTEEGPEHHVHPAD